MFNGKVLVAGANGGTGRQTVERLTHYKIPVRAMVRSEEKAAPFRAAGIETVIADVRFPDQLKAAVAGVNAVICATGTRVGFSASGSSLKDFFGFGDDGAEAVDLVGTQNLIDAAKAAGVSHFVLVTSMLINQPLNPFSLMMKPFGDILAVKGKGEEVLRRSGLRYTIVRPGGLTNEPFGQKGIKIAPADALTSGSISRADVAEVCVQSLWNDAALNKTFEIVNDTTPPVTEWNKSFAAVV